MTSNQIFNLARTRRCRYSDRVPNQHCPPCRCRLVLGYRHNYRTIPIDSLGANYSTCIALDVCTSLVMSLLVQFYWDRLLHLFRPRTYAILFACFYYLSSSRNRDLDANRGRTFSTSATMFTSTLLLTPLLLVSRFVSFGHARTITHLIKDNDLRNGCAFNLDGTIYDLCPLFRSARIVKGLGTIVDEENDQRERSSSSQHLYEVSVESRTRTSAQSSGTGASDMMVCSSLNSSASTEKCIVAT